MDTDQSKPETAIAIQPTPPAYEEQLDRIRNAAIALRTGSAPPALGYGYSGNPMPIFDTYVGAYVVEKVVDFLQEHARGGRMYKGANLEQKQQRLVIWADKALDIFFEGAGGHALVRAETARRTKHYLRMHGKNITTELSEKIHQKARLDAQGQLRKQAQRYRDRLVHDATQQLWNTAEDRIHNRNTITYECT